MLGPEYTNIYTVSNDLSVNDLSGDFYKLKNYILDNTNNPKPPYQNVFDISLINFDQYDNTIGLDLNYRNIFNIKKTIFKKPFFKYILFDFTNNVSLNNFKLFDNNGNQSTFKICSKNNSNSYNTLSDISNSAIIQNDNSLLLEVQGNTNGFPSKISYEPIVSQNTIFIDYSKSIINYYYVNGTFVDKYQSPDSTILQNIASGINTYTTNTNQLYSVEEFNQYLQNNVNMLYGSTVFNSSAITINNSNNYRINFNYLSPTDSLSPNTVYIDLSSNIFTILGINNFSSINTETITYNNNTINVIRLTNNTNLSLDFTFFPFRNVKIKYSINNMNSEYEQAGTIENIIDKVDTLISVNKNINYSFPITKFDKYNIIYKTNNGILFTINDVSSTTFTSNILNSNFLKSDKLYSNISSTDLHMSNTVDVSNIIGKNVTVSGTLTIESVSITNSNLTSADLSGITTVSNNSYINNIQHSIDISTNETDKNIINIHDSSFISIEKINKYTDTSFNRLIFSKNIKINDLSCNEISANNINYNLINNIQITDLSINDTLYSKKNIYIKTSKINNQDNEAISINNSKTKLAYYINQRRIRDISHNGYRMEIGPYETSVNNSGWYIKMLGENNKFCKNDASIRLLPEKSPEIFTTAYNGITVFEIDSDFLKHSSTTAPIMYSDDRIKHNEQDISNALDTIDKLRPVTYLKKHSSQSNYSKFESGFIAQDIKNIPELKHVVHETTHDKNIPQKLSINYNSIQPYITKAIQELYHDISNIKQQLNS